MLWCASYWWGGGDEVCGVMGRVVSWWYFVWFGEWVGMCLVSGWYFVWYGEWGGGMFGVMCAMVDGIVNEVFRVIWCA